MHKTEIICNSCELQYIVVTKGVESVCFCPFCSEPYSDELEIESLEALEDE